MLNELLSLEPLSKILPFPIKNKEGKTFYYKVIEINELKKSILKDKALKYTKEALSKQGYTIDLKSKEMLSLRVQEIFDEIYEKYYFRSIVAETALDPETNKKIFTNPDTLLELDNIHKDLFAKLYENYEDFVNETSPYLSSVSDESIKELASALESEVDSSFLDGACLNYCKRDLKRLIFFLACNKRQKLQTQSD